MSKKIQKIKKKISKIACDEKIKKIHARWLTSLVIFLIVVLFSGLFLIGYKKAYAQKIYPGVRVDNISLTNKTKEEAREILKDSTDEIYNQGITFRYKNRQTIITPIITSPTDPDISYEILNFDIDNTVEKAYSFGHKDNTWTNIKESISSLIKDKKIQLDYFINEDELINILKENFQDFEKQGNNAGLVITFEKNLESDDYQTEITQEKLGSIFDYQNAINRLKENIENLDNQPIELGLKTDYPEIDIEKAKMVLDKTDEILNQSPLTLKYGDKNWVLEKRDLAGFLDFGYLNNELKIILKEDFKNKLKEIAQEINIPAQDAKFEIKDSKVTQFQGSKDGLELDIKNNYEIINHQFINEKNNEVELAVKTLPSKVATGTTNDLGIGEIIGIGESDFSGSPQNRRHNIAVGANTLNGLLIKPDEEFSLITALGDINAANGYLPELVIKGNKTVPEYGGGLCQIGTTTFRVALDSGLEITERRPHSYRVSYYEPAGTDATIYNPKPDLKFINDTGNYILIQTKIDGNKLIFEFWGTSDGRKTEMTDPIIYNFVAPGPTKMVETEDLEPGKKRCTESAHTGADAKFTRTITFANGDIEEEVWESHYVPWQAVCLIGVEPGTLDKEDNNESADDAEAEINQDNEENPEQNNEEKNNKE